MRDARSSAAIAGPSSWTATPCTKCWRATGPTSPSRTAGPTRNASLRRTPRIGRRRVARSTQLIGDLYAVERLVPGPFPGDAAAQALRSQLRQARSHPIVDRIWRGRPSKSACRAASSGRRCATCSSGGPASRGSSMIRAFRSITMPPSARCAGRWSAARIITGRSRSAARRSPALFYTLCESAKLVGIDPHTYLLTATEAALATPGAVTLPDALLAAVTA